MFSTTARIQPTSLPYLNDPVQSSVGLKPKIVDFALVLCPSEAIADALRNLATQPDLAEPHATVPTLDYTALHTIVDCLIGISIETKTDGENKTEALNQLTTWAFAHMARLH